MRSSKRLRTQRWPVPQPVTTTSGRRRIARKVTIGKLPGEVLLNVFLHCLDVSPQFWPTLVHVCQTWRQIIFTSPLTLHLRLYCKHGTPVSKTLGCWPVLPIVVQYGGSSAIDSPSPEDEDNVIAALKQSDRVSSISLTITSSLLTKFFSIKEPFSDLEELVLLSRNSMGLALPSTFKWGSRLRRLQSTGIALPSLPRLLSPSLDLVDLQLHEVPSAGYFSPEEFASALSGLTRLQSLSLHFLSPASRPSHIDLSPSHGERVVLPALTRLKFRGASEYVNNLVTRIDAPSLVDIEVRFFNQLVFHLSQLRQFIDQIKTQKLHRRADIEFSGHAVSITFTQPAASRARLILQISCEQLDWQLSSMAQICDNVSPFLPSVQDLGINTTQQLSGMDDVDGEQWLELIRAFNGAKDFRVASELTTDILRTLRSVDQEHIAVLPALRNLHIPGLVSIDGPLREAVESFTTSRGLLNHPVEVSPSLYPHDQWSPSIDDWELDVIPPSELPPLSPIFGKQPYDDDAFPFNNIMHNHILSINIDTTVPLSHLNTRGLSFPNSSTPLTPGFVSPSQPGYSSPSLLAVPPPTPALNLGNTHDTFPVFSPSTPVSPYGSQYPPWTIPKPNPSPEPEHFLPLSQFQRGPMVPQKRYKPHTSSDRRRYVDEVNLEPSIHFYMQKPDEEGIPLKDAMHGRFARLVSRDEPMFQERGPSISVRINWPGYQPWSRQIPTRDFRNPPVPITRAKLAKNVAKSVARFIQEHKGRQMEEGGDATWLVGPGKIDVFDLVLVRLDHVSKGSWQAQLQLVRPMGMLL